MQTLAHSDLASTIGEEPLALYIRASALSRCDGSVVDTLGP